MTERVAGLVSQLLELRKPTALAELFCALDDDNQAQFFAEVARIMDTWNGQPDSYGSSWQIHAIAEHMKTCTCAGGGARWVEELAECLQQPATGHANV